MQLVTRFILIAGLLLGPAAAWAAPAGTVVGLSGDCTIEHAGVSGPAALARGVEVGDTVDVPAGAKLKLRMADGSVVSVAPETKMTVTTYGVTDAGKREDAKLSLSQGLLRIVVTPVSGPPAPFEVETAVGTSAVRSTDWFVETQQGWVQVAVLAGNVTLTSAATGAATAVTARRGARLEAGQEPAAVRAWTTAEFNRLIARTAFPPARPAPKKPVQRREPSKSSDEEYIPGPGDGYAPPPGDGYAPPPGGGYGPPPGGGYMPPPGGYYRPPPGGGYAPPPWGGYHPPRGGGSYPSPGGGYRTPGNRSSGAPYPSDTR